MNPFGRLLFYISAGICSALLGWSISHLLLFDLIGILSSLYQVVGLGSSNLEIPPFLILIIITPFMALSIVVTEIFISNPTRYKSNWRVLERNLLPAVAMTGLIAGTILSLLNWQLLSSNWQSSYIRILSWSLIGLFTGLAEGISWRFYSIEGSNIKAIYRIIQSTILGIFSGLFSAITYDSIRHIFSQYQEPIGFIILGIFLSISLSFTSHHSYQVALRAGHGFESRDSEKSKFSTLNHTRFSDKSLSLVPTPEGKFDNLIEEGLSITLPSNANKEKPITIGSHKEADIIIPDIPEKCASLWLEKNIIKIKCDHNKSIRIQQSIMSIGDIKTLRHNQIITLYYKNEPEEFYRLIFYDRFLDPQA